MLGYTSPNPVTKTKLNLNKRVAFPMQKSPAAGTNQVKLSSSGLPLPHSGGSSSALSPPPPAVFNNGCNLPLNPPPSIIPSGIGTNLPKEVENNELMSNEIARDFSLKTFTEVLTKLKLTKDDNKYEEIYKRLEILKTMWLDDKIDSKISEILYKMAKSLESDDIVKAGDYHRALIIDGGSICSQWASALRQLIILCSTGQSDEPVSVTEDVKLINLLSDETKNYSKNNFSKIYHI